MSKKTFLKFFISLMVIILIISAVLYISSIFRDISAIIIMVDNNDIYVKTDNTIKEGEKISPHPTYYIINADGSTFYDVNGRQISISELKGGDSIRINYKVESDSTPQIAYEFTPINNVKSIKVLDTNLNEGTNSKININGLEAKINLDNDPDISISYNYPKYNSSTNITSTASIKSELNDNEKNELYKYFKDFGYHIMPFSNGNYIGDEYYKIDFNNGIYLKLGTSGLEVDVYENDHRVFRTSLSDDLVNKIRGGY